MCHVDVHLVLGGCGLSAGMPHERKVQNHEVGISTT